MTTDKKPFTMEVKSRPACLPPIPPLEITFPNPVEGKTQFPVAPPVFMTAADRSDGELGCFMQYWLDRIRGTEVSEDEPTPGVCFRANQSTDFVLIFSPVLKHYLETRGGAGRLPRRYQRYLRPGWSMVMFDDITVGF